MEVRLLLMFSIIFLSAAFFATAVFFGEDLFHRDALVSLKLLLFEVFWRLGICDGVWGFNCFEGSFVRREFFFLR